MQLRGDYNSTSAVNSAAKSIVTIIEPPSAAVSVSGVHLGSRGCRPTSMSTLTLASGPTSLLLDATLGDGGRKTGSVSAANTPVAPAGKHTSFALTPTIMGASPASPASGSGNHVTFMPSPMMGVKHLRDSNSSSSLSSPSGATVVATGSAPTLVEVAKSPTEKKHTVLDMRQSVQSQITTLEDVNDVDDEQGSENNSSDSDSDSVGVALVQTTPQLEYQAGIGSSSSSDSIK